MPINTHPFSNEDVMAYLDGELSAEAAAEMTAHLAQCRICQDVAADLQSVSRQLSGWAIEARDAEAIPAQISTALDARTTETKHKQAHFRPWRLLRVHPWTVVVPATLGVLVVSFLWTSAKPSIQMVNKTRTPISESRMAADVFVPKESARRMLRTMAEPLKAERAASDAQNLGVPTLVVRTAEIRLTARTFDTVRTDLDRILVQFGGHIAQLSLASPTNEARNLTATLRIPSPQLNAAMAELRKLGRVDGESQRGEEVTQQSVDLDARLTNLRHTEQRLTQILATRTGKLSDVLEVEEKLSQVRGEIEQAEAEQKNLNNRVSLATVSLQVSEDYRVPLTGTIAPSTGTKLSNSATEGVHSAFDALVGIVQLLLAVGPTLIALSLVLALPGYFLWKKLRHR